MINKNNIFDEIKDAVPIVSYGAEVILKENKQQNTLLILNFISFTIKLILTVIMGILIIFGRIDLCLFGFITLYSFIFRDAAYNEYLESHDNAFNLLVKTNTRIGLFKEFKKDWLMDSANKLSKAHISMIHKIIVAYVMLTIAFILVMFAQRELVTSSLISIGITIVCIIYIMMNIHIMASYTNKFMSNVYLYNTKLNEFLNKYPNEETDVG